MRVRLQRAVAGELECPTPILARGIAAGFADSKPAMLGEVLATLEAAPRPEPWRSYWAACAPLGAIGGLCGFKSAPDRRRAVEIAYFTFPASKGRGVATAMARGLVEIAADHGMAAVLAHTLPERNASTSVLSRLGFTLAGPVVDPEDGEVWRWSLDIRQRPGG